MMVNAKRGSVRAEFGARCASHAHFFYYACGRPEQNTFGVFGREVFPRRDAPA